MFIISERNEAVKELDATRVQIDQLMASLVAAQAAANLATAEAATAQAAQVTVQAEVAQPQPAQPDPAKPQGMNGRASAPWGVQAPVAVDAAPRVQQPLGPMAPQVHGSAGDNVPDTSIPCPPLPYNVEQEMGCDRASFKVIQVSLAAVYSWSELTDV